MSKRRQHLGQAFTFLELLVVVGLIGILAILLLPVLVPVRQPAPVKRVQFEMAAIAHAIWAYEAGKSIHHHD